MDDKGANIRLLLAGHIICVWTWLTSALVIWLLALGIYGVEWSFMAWLISVAAGAIVSFLLMTQIRNLLGLPRKRDFATFVGLGDDAKVRFQLLGPVPHLSVNTSHPGAAWPNALIYSFMAFGAPVGISVAIALSSNTTLAATLAAGAVAAGLSSFQMALGCRNEYRRRQGDSEPSTASADG